MTWIWKAPLVLLVGMIILTMLLAAVPFIMVGFVIGFARWAGEIGDRLADKMIIKFLY